MSYAHEADNPNIRVLTGNAFAEARDARLREYRQKWQENPEQGIVERFPIHLDIESTSICNLKCPFCAGTHEKYDLGMMSQELFRKIVDEGSVKGLYSLKLNFRGEPLLHPQIADFVAYAKEKGIVDVFFNTNAVLLTAETGRKLIAAGLDRLIVSFEGLTKETYEANRVGATFEKVVHNVREFARLKREMHSTTPILRLQTVAIEPGEGYLRQYQDFWAPYADEITCIDLRDENRDYSMLPGTGWHCSYPWLRLCITWNGRVLTCPFVNRAAEKYSWPGLGTVADSSLEEIWHSPEMQKIRDNHRGGTSQEIEPCRLCSYRGTELLKRKEQP